MGGKKTQVGLEFPFLGETGRDKLKTLAGPGQEELMLYRSTEGRRRAVMGLS